MHRPIVAVAMRPVLACRFVKVRFARIPPAFLGATRRRPADHHPLRLDLEHQGKREVGGGVHGPLQKGHAGCTRRACLHLARVHAGQRGARVADRLDDAREVFLGAALVAEQRVNGVHAGAFQVVGRCAALRRVLVAVHAHRIIPPVQKWRAAAVLRADVVRVDDALGPARARLAFGHVFGVGRERAHKVEPHVDVLVVVLHDTRVQGQRHVVAVGS